jgi:NAD(P)-dependent dehydrogenase (short-subunit alcohol dehydrogenase family)
MAVLGEKMQVVLITETENEFNKKLAAAFILENYKVYSMGEEQKSGVTPLPSDLKEAVNAIKREGGHIDIYIDVSDRRSPSDNFNIRGAVNDEVMRNLFETNVIRPMAMLEAFMPLLETGKAKRLCYLTAAEASINETFDTEGFGYKMAKAGLHNFLQITRNVLAPRGYTFRVYDPMYDKVSAEFSVQAAINYFIRRRGIEGGDPQRDDEDNLVFRDAYGRQHSW